MLNPDEVAHLLHLFVGIILLGIPVKAFLDFRWGVVNWRTVFWRGNLGPMCYCLDQLGLGAMHYHLPTAGQQCRKAGTSKQGCTFPLLGSEHW
jgi:hypothetical protein